jgi:hypothetical protein
MMMIAALHESPPYCEMHRQDRIPTFWDPFSSDLFENSEITLWYGIRMKNLR